MNEVSHKRRSAENITDSHMLNHVLFCVNKLADTFIVSQMSPFKGHGVMSWLHMKQSRHAVHRTPVERQRERLALHWAGKAGGGNKTRVDGIHCGIELPGGMVNVSFQRERERERHARWTKAVFSILGDIFIIILSLNSLSLSISLSITNTHTHSNTFNPRY